MNLPKTQNQALTKNQTDHPKDIKLENAYILSAEMGDRIRIAFMEIPRKYNQLIGPLEEALSKAYRGTITVSLDSVQAETKQTKNEEKE
jgi:hypothetical protein